MLVVADGQDLVEKEIWRFFPQRVLDINLSYSLVDMKIVKEHPAIIKLIAFQACSLVAGVEMSASRRLMSSAQTDVMTRMDLIASMTHDALQH